jgi:ankyrin repeat protein
MNLRESVIITIFTSKNTFESVPNSNSTQQDFIIYAAMNIVDSDDETALMRASKYGLFEVVKIILSFKNIDINQKDYYGETALIYAAQGGNNLDTMELLLKHPGIDINAKNKKNRDAFSLANNSQHREMLKKYGYKNDSN